MNVPCSRQWRCWPDAIQTARLIVDSLPERGPSTLVVENGPIVRIDQ